MSCCGLGVNAFRSSVQIAAQHLCRPTTRLLPAPSSSRCLSSWPSAIQRQWKLRYGRPPIVASYALLPRNHSSFLPQCPGIRTIFNGAVVTHYVDIPPNYTDHDGLPFRKRDLEAHEVIALFGPTMSTAAANQLLRILHGRRVAGTLEDPNLQVNTAHFTKQQQKIALEYLRKHVPVDEIANAGLRAEDELAALENPDADETGTSFEPGYKSRLKLYKEQDDQGKRSVYGTSQLDEIRARNQAKWEARVKRQEEEKRKREAEERHGKPGGLQVVDETPQKGIGRIRLPSPSPALQRYAALATSDLQEPPKMPGWKRILPSAVFALAVTGLAVAYAEFYQPPKRADRMFPDIPPAAATIGALMLANVLGWLVWKLPPAWPFLNRYFMLDAAVPRALTVLSSMFSHQKFLHLVPNMVALWVLGTRLHDEVGRGTFLATYLSSGTIGAVGTLAWAVATKRLATTSLGASGGVYGVMAAYLWTHRLETFRILGLPPPPSEGFHGTTFLALAVGSHVGILLSRRVVLTDIAAHMTGLAVGVGAAHLLEKKKEAQRQPQGRLKQGGSVAPQPVTKEQT
ncbi:Rhomboid protein 1, mitochondrial [Madurella mycetomatis]|uniref:Rhomboid protein 1, mitochondrial n=1 Tax=Madurella mycetomatis TaxID=100816 RepID=A0A175WAZ2_9PEZI|nr:Rhomboid protein 1, mitochondrial [Madurella mycetomatis]